MDSKGFVCIVLRTIDVQTSLRTGLSQRPLGIGNSISNPHDKAKGRLLPSLCFMDSKGFEPSTSRMRTERSPS